MKVQNIHWVRFENKHTRRKPCYMEYNTQTFNTLGYIICRNYCHL